MSVRDGIPPDIWDTANSVAARKLEVGALFSENYVRPIALAILAERARCARIAARHKHDDYGRQVYELICSPSLQDSEV